jgi:hypothetical protein
VQSEFSSKVEAWCSEAKELDGRIQHSSNLIASMKAAMDGSAGTDSSWTECPELTKHGKALIESCDPMAFKALVLKQGNFDNMTALAAGLAIVCSAMQKAVQSTEVHENTSAEYKYKRHAEQWVTQAKARAEACSNRLSDLLKKEDRAAKLGKQTRQPKSNIENCSSAGDSTGTFEGYMLLMHNSAILMFAQGSSLHIQIHAVQQILLILQLQPLHPRSWYKQYLLNHRSLPPLGNGGS